MVNFVISNNKRYDMEFSNSLSNVFVVEMMDLCDSTQSERCYSTCIGLSLFDMFICLLKKE